jgi:alpha-beta hydrolase superfamily lysophospholipase
MEPLANTIPTAATGSCSTPLIHASIRSLLLGNSLSGYISLREAIAQAPVSRYTKIELPLLIIAGAADKSSSLDDASYIMKQYGSKTKELRVLQRVGHWHVIETYTIVHVLIGTLSKEL